MIVCEIEVAVVFATALISAALLLLFTNGIYCFFASRLDFLALDALFVHSVAVGQMNPGRDSSVLSYLWTEDTADGAQE